MVLVRAEFLIVPSRMELQMLIKGDFSWFNLLLGFAFEKCI